MSARERKWLDRINLFLIVSLFILTGLLITQPRPEFTHYDFTDDDVPSLRSDAGSQH